MTLALLAAAWLAGLLVGLRYSAETLPVFLLALAMVPVAFLLRIYGRSPGIAIVLGLFLLGVWRPQVSGMPESPLTLQEEQEVSLSGRIVNDPEPTARRIKFELYAQWQKTLERHRILPIRLFAGYRIQLDQDISLDVLHPPGAVEPARFIDANNNGLVLRLVYRDVSILLTADIEAGVEQRLLNASATIKSDVLKIAHHGSKTSTTAPFLQRVQPSLAIISAGADNRFGHPHAEVVNRLQHTLGDRNIYRTYQNGDIEVISDGTTLWVKTQR